MIAYLILTILCSLFVAVIFAIRLGSVRGQEWDLMAAKQRQRYER